MKRTALSLLLSCVLVVTLACATLAQPQSKWKMPPPAPQIGYVALDLHQTMQGVGTDTTAMAINDRGTVVLMAGKVGRSFVLQSNAFRAVPLSTPESWVSFGRRISNSGLVAGNLYSDITGGRGAAWSATSRKSFDVDSLEDINDQGIAVGNIWPSCYVVDTGSGAISQLSTGNLPNGEVFAINSAGFIAGRTFDYHYGSSSRATVWAPNGTPTLLDSGDWELATAVDINDSNIVIGKVSSWGVGTRAIVWQNGIGSLLPTLGRTSYAAAINAKGAITGTSIDGTGDQGRQWPVVWQNGSITKLPLLPGATYGGAYDINANGVVVGFCRFPDRDLQAVTHATIWVPCRRVLPF
jgi:uncharacterized membrane protein